jgi:hypothetical protein
VFSRDVVQEDFKDFGIQVPEALEKRTQDARNNWLKARESFNFGGKKASSASGGLSPEKMSRYQELKNKQNR